MTALLRGELLKLRTTRTFVVLVAVAVLLSLAITVLVASRIEPSTEDDVRDVLLSDISALFILVLAAVGMTGEWRHRTITGTVLAAPDRVRVLLSKMLAYALAGVVLSLAVTVTVMVLGTVVLSSRDQLTLGIDDLASILWRNLVLAAYFGAIGVAVGALVRNQPAALVGLLVWLLIVEPAVLAVAPEVGRFGPLIGAPGGFFSGEDTELLDRGAAIAVMLAWLAALGGGAAALLRRRDLS